MKLTSLKLPKLPSLKERIFDILLIECSGINYIQFEIKETKIEVLKDKKIQISIFNQNVLNLNNLEVALNQIISQEQVQELGIILHIPNILFQKINLVKSPNIEEAIYNYLKTTFPLPLDQYRFFFKEDPFQKTGNISAFNIYFINKELVTRLLMAVEQYNLIPLFITFSAEAFYHYLLKKTLIEFYSEYLIFFIDQHLISILWIDNLRVGKVIFEEIFPETNIGLTILRFYNFFKTNFSAQTKILFFSQKDFPIPTEIKEQKFIFNINPRDVFLESGQILFEKVFADEKFIDFLPIKPRSAYFIRRLPKIFNLLSIFLGSLILIFAPFYFYVYFQFKKQEKELSSQIIRVKSTDYENKVRNFLKLTQDLDFKSWERFQLLNQIQKISSLETIIFDKEKVIFSMKIKKEDLAKIQSLLSRSFPQIKPLGEEFIGDEVRLTYQL